jgi:hypothetical protein
MRHVDAAHLACTPSVSKKNSQLCLDKDVYKHVLAIDSSIARKGCDGFLGT